VPLAAAAKVQPRDRLAGKARRPDERKPTESGAGLPARVGETGGGAKQPHAAVGRADANQSAARRHPDRSDGGNRAKMDMPDALGGACCPYAHRRHRSAAAIRVEPKRDEGRV